MKTSLEVLENVLPNLQINPQDIMMEAQNEAYEGLSIPSQQLRSRLANKTPKKAGYFVAHYVKENGTPNRPYTVDEALDTLAIIIAGEGAFLFPKDTLVRHGILSNQKIGKMAFRVYLPTEQNLNKMATKTQAWQAAYFVTNNKRL